MDPTIIDSLDGLRSMLAEDDPAIQVHLSALIQHVSDLLAERKTEDLDRIRLGLQKTIRAKQPEHSRSYALGMADAIIQTIDFSVVKQQNESRLLQLSLHEQEILKYLYAHPRSTPTQIMTALRLGTRQNASNYLRKLKTKEFVGSQSGGRNQWYSLSSKGHKAAERLLSEEQQASASAVANARTDVQTVKLSSHQLSRLMNISIPMPAYLELPFNGNRHLKGQPGSSYSYRFADAAAVHWGEIRETFKFNGLQPLDIIAKRGEEDRDGDRLFRDRPYYSTIN